MSRRGVLFLVVGPSGVGKDSLIDGARERLADDRRFVFPRRFITRPSDPGGEGHRAVDDPTFDDLLRGGAFALWWAAHGLRYGIPMQAEGDLGCGRSVVVNVSRGVVDEARARFPPVCVLQIKAARSTLRARLRARGREDHEAIEERLDRAEAFLVAGVDVRVVANDGDLNEAICAFVDALDQELTIPLSDP